MVFPFALSRLALARVVAALVVCATCLLASVETASAADITISYVNAHGVANAEREGTSRYQGNDATETNVTVSLWTVADVTDNGLECDPSSNSEPKECDVYDVFSGSVEVKSPCEPYGGDVLCPDAERFTATLGGGTNDSYVLDAPLQYESATVTAGNGGDYIEGTNPPEYKGEFPDQDIFTGGAGNDRLVGGPGNDIVKGGPGEDIIDGRGGEDQLYGEGGNDQITGGASGKSLESGGEGTNKLGVTFNPEAPDWDSYDGGNETFDGEGGISTVSFFHAPGPVTANVNGLPDSGVAGQQDTIEENVSEVEGSENNDTLTAGKAPVTLDGEGGNDTIYGGPGGDTLRGGGGNDTINTSGPAGVGPDSIYASEAYCSIYVSCPAGNTTIYANDGIQDQISCGPGADIVYADSCAGVFKPTEPLHSQLFVNLPASPTPNANHVNIEITPIALPTQGLSVAPAGCEDNGSPPLFHSFEGAFGGEIRAPDTHLSLDVAKSGRGVGAYAFAEQRNVPDTVVLPASFLNNCGEPAVGLTCNQGWDPPNAEEEAGHGEVFIGRERLK
jgi:Ca2+-binding RTX toxin-like protein